MSTSDRAAIDRIREAHIAALNAGDAEGLAALFAPDGVQMPPHAPANLGRESILAWCRAFLAPFRIEFSLAVDEVQVAGDWAYERGLYRLALAPRTGGGAMEDEGKYITIYARQSGDAWAVARDIWNSDLPPPAP